jgi:hypothetical protein
MVWTYVHLGWRQQGIHTKFSRVTLWKRPLGRQRKRLEDNIKLQSKERHCDCKGSDSASCLIVDLSGVQNSCSATTVLIICYREGEFPSRDCPKCNEEQCPKPEEACPQGLVPDICGCCLHGLCGLAEGEKCFNASLSAVLPPETKKYGQCGANLHCLLRPDLTSRVSDFHTRIFH